MRLTIKLLSLIILCSLAFSACEEKTIVLTDAEAGYQYYPVEKDKYWIYRVDSTIVSTQGAIKPNSASFIKEEIADSFINSQGDTAFIIQRSIASSLAGPYQFTDRWTIEKTRATLTRIEENLQFVRILFPVMLGDSWDGNKFDQKTKVIVGQEKMEPYLEWEYRVSSKNTNITLNRIEYSEVLEIQEADYETDIERRLSTAYYAENIGLIFREMLITDAQNPQTLGQPWKDRAEAGFWMTQTLIEHN